MSKQPARKLGVVWGLLLVAHTAGVIVTAVVVLVQYELSTAWLAAQPLVVAAAFVALWAWVRGRWWMAAAALVVTLVGPWGYFYVGPLAALVLIGVAVVRAARPRQAPINRK